MIKINLTSPVMLGMLGIVYKCPSSAHQFPDKCCGHHDEKITKY